MSSVQECLSEYACASTVRLFKSVCAVYKSVCVMCVSLCDCSMRAVCKRTCV